LRQRDQRERINRETERGKVPGSEVRRRWVALSRKVDDRVTFGEEGKE
jgi:hypothetical protein